MGIITSSTESDNLFADINVTPLVDVMLVLLIIFMVTAPFMMETIGVDLPKGQGAHADGKNTPLTISIDKNENIFIKNQQFSYETLLKFLRESPLVQKGQPIYVEADEIIHHKVLMKVMSVAYEAGAHRINILMEAP
jgi:biopolymer transport protein TolR